MPAFTGNVTINSVAGSGIVEFGDTIFISPKFATKNNNGAASSNTGGLIKINSAYSSIGVAQTNLVDQPIVRDN